MPLAAADGTKNQCPGKWGGCCSQRARRLSELMFVHKNISPHKISWTPGWPIISGWQYVRACCAGEKSWSMLHYTLALDIGCCGILLAARMRVWCFLPQHKILSKKPRGNRVHVPMDLLVCQWFLSLTSSLSPVAVSTVLTVALWQTNPLKTHSDKSWS